MTFKPKPIDIFYSESLVTNSSMLIQILRKNQLEENEICFIIAKIKEDYFKEVDGILKEYNKDFMALENVESPLDLFRSSLERFDYSKMSQRCQKVLKGFICKLKEIDL